MLSDAFDSFRNYLSERFTSPLIGAFTVAWCLFNYQVFVILFSGETAVRKFGLINSLVFPDEASYWTYGFLYPLLFALAYVLVYPWPARWIYVYLRWQQRRWLAAKIRLDDETPLTREQVREFNRTNREFVRQYERDIEERDNTIVGLKRDIQELEQRLRDCESNKNAKQGLDDELFRRTQARNSIMSAAIDGTTFELADTAPREAIVKSWKAVEAALEEAADTAGASYPPGSAELVTGVLARRSFLGSSDINVIHKMHQMYESLVQHPHVIPTADEARQYAGDAQGVVFHLGQAMRAWGGTAQ